MSYYLFVHFREKTTPLGEQVYFAVSDDAFHWEAINGGLPVLWAYYGDKGVRDHTVAWDELSGKLHILSTDLSLAYGFRNQYARDWGQIVRHGSKCLSHWASSDGCIWSEQRLVRVGSEALGCCWAPDMILDRSTGDHIVHWSSPSSADHYAKMRIYYARTRDFETFSAPEVLYEKEDSGVIDSAMYEEDGLFYLFVKCDQNPSGIILLRSPSVTGPWERVSAFDDAMAPYQNGLYEAPTAVRLDDGRWCLFIDYYGVRGAGQGYVPFIADSLASGAFRRADEDFEFPYGFKHGTIVRIDEAMYNRIRTHDYDVDDYSSYG